MKTDIVTKFQAQVDLEMKSMRIKIDQEIEGKRIELEAVKRREIGLTHLEQDADVIFTKLQEAVVELTFYHEMDKNKFVLDNAALKIANTRTMYDSVCRKIFKICLKHGFKSEHMK